MEAFQLIDLALMAVLVVVQVETTLLVLILKVMHLPILIQIDKVILEQILVQTMVQVEAVVELAVLLNPPFQNHMDLMVAQVVRVFRSLLLDLLYWCR